jgi:hypothetical protein
MINKAKLIEWLEEELKDADDYCDNSAARVWKIVLTEIKNKRFEEENDD